MPLIKIETLHPDCKWALWEITETFEELSSELDLSKEAENMESIKNDLKKREKTAGRLLLKKIMESWGETYDGTNSDSFGKPFLKNQNYFASISHSQGYTVAIIDKNHNIGIDIESIKEKIVQIAPRVFSSEEIGPDRTGIARLITLWTIKESLYKLYGERGLNFRENIRIKPFNFNEVQGDCTGEVRANETVSSYTIRYSRYRNFIIAYILNQKT